MKKVVYSVTKIGKFNQTKQSGIGYITDEDLIVAFISQSNKPYIKIFEDCLKDLHPNSNSRDEFKGYYYEIAETELTDDKGRRTTKEIEVNYYIWYKIIEE